MTATRSGFTRLSCFAAAAVPAFLLAFDERQQLIHLRHKLAVAAQNFAGRIEADLRAIDQPMGLGQAIDHVRRRTRAA